MQNRSCGWQPGSLPIPGFHYLLSHALCAKKSNGPQLWFTAEGRLSPFVIACLGRTADVGGTHACDALSDRTKNWTIGGCARYLIRIGGK